MRIGQLARRAGLTAFLSLGLLVTSTIGAVASAAPAQGPQMDRGMGTGTQIRQSAVMINARYMFPGPNSAFNNVTTRALRSAYGQVRVTVRNYQRVRLSINATGLRHNWVYRVYIDGNGVTWNRPATADDFTALGTITTDREGDIDWRTVNAGTWARGWHRWSIFLDDTVAGKSVLVSDNLHFYIS